MSPTSCISSIALQQPLPNSQRNPPSRRPLCQRSISQLPHSLLLRIVTDAAVPSDPAVFRFVTSFRIRNFPACPPAHPPCRPQRLPPASCSLHRNLRQIHRRRPRRRPLSRLRCLRRMMSSRTFPSKVCVHEQRSQTCKICRSRANCLEQTGRKKTQRFLEEPVTSGKRAGMMTMRMRTLASS